MKNILISLDLEFFFGISEENVNICANMFFNRVVSQAVKNANDVVYENIELCAPEDIGSIQLMTFENVWAGIYPFLEDFIKTVTPGAEAVHFNSLLKVAEEKENHLEMLSFMQRKVKKQLKKEIEEIKTLCIHDETAWELLLLIIKENLELSTNEEARLVLLTFAKDYNESLKN